MNRSRSQGFTLIEVLISLGIFTLIGLATVKNISQIQTTKDMAFQEMDLYNGIRSALSVMRYDLSQAFHILYDDLGDENKQLVQQNQPAPHTLFDGRKGELIFTAMSHRVYYTGLRESEQTEISYFLQQKPNATVPTLMKRESEIIDADLYSGGPTYSILDNVISMQFQYWDMKNAKWVDDWNSDNGQFRDQFPQAVKVKLSVAGKEKKPLEVQAEFKVAFPNNDAMLVQF